jgi:outer membrane receptor protein involved in Fe transport
LSIGHLVAPRCAVARLAVVLLCAAASVPVVGEELAAAADTDAGSDPLQQVTVTAERLKLLGNASSASEGVVNDQELQLTPQYRPGQTLETVPGLIVTLHSGEGKANQYLLRGYNLDHGTDLETYVDGVPVNQPTHAHGQGYTDLNFMIPELQNGLTYTKGPYYADVGDFGAVGSVRISYRDSIPDQIAIAGGSFDFRRVLIAGSQAVGQGTVLAAVEAQHYDGPFTNPDDARRGNAVLRYSAGDAHSGYSVTGMFYHQLWNSTTDIPERAVANGTVVSRFDTLDPTDGGRAQRASLSAQYHAEIGDGKLTASSFYEYNQLHLYNNFTHFLVDPVHGDQEVQFENRRAIGAAVSYSTPITLAEIEHRIDAGLLGRYDLLGVGRLPTQSRAEVPPINDPPSFSNDDHVYLFAGAAYLQMTTRWTPELRSVLGLRLDYQHGTDVDYLAALHEMAGYSNAGTAHQSLLQPKASLIYTPSSRLEFYLSAGQGFHSADLRGVNQARNREPEDSPTPLLAKQDGQEIGLRAAPASNFAFTLAVFNLWQQSETILDPDIGQDASGPPSRRYGYEINVTWQINHYLELYGSYSGDHTRFTHPLDDGTGHLGNFISGAPIATGSLALYLTNLGRWSGGLNFRYLGNYPLSSGPCVDSAAVRDFPSATSCADAPTAAGQVDAKGFGELNLEAQYRFDHGWAAALGIYNVLNTHAAAAQFWYVDRLKSEIDTAPDGIADVHQHPLEPLMFRLTISKQFGS